MPQRTASCQLGVPTPGDSRLISPQSGDTECPPVNPDTHNPTIEFEHATDYSAGGTGRGGRLLVNAASQWLHATTGRIATCAHSWMTAVHWIDQLATKGLYKPTQTHGPKWGHTTLLIAQEIAALKVCRPGIAYLMRKLKLSERTIQYHLTMLRETGLLVYRSKGTRRRGGPNEASVYERTIPTTFDDVHGIRTVGEGVQRRPVGVAEHARTLIGKLAKKAARKPRRRPSRTRNSGTRRCTPMQGGTSTGPSTGLTSFPSETELASGEAESPTQKKPNRGPQKPKAPKTLNKVGHRYQLARELIRLIPWLRGASTPRIAWIIRHVADAGWTALEIQAIAEDERPILASEVRRPSGLLADRLGNRHLLFTTPERRQTAVHAWQESRLQEKARHVGYDDLTTDTRHATAADVQALVAEAFRRVDQIAAGPVDDSQSWDIHADAPDTALEDLDRELVKQVRVEAQADLSVITDAINAGLPETDARRLYTNWLVDQALAAERRAQLAPAF